MHLTLGILRVAFLAAFLFNAFCISIVAFHQFLIQFMYIFLFLGIFHFTVYSLI